LRRYWTLPVDEPVCFRKASDYIDRFKELLDQAVADRLRTKKISVFMSGGLDSPALAATACRILRSRSADCEVRAFTTVINGFDRNERYYARLVAEHLGIPIHFRDLSGKACDPAWAEAEIHTPEPVANPLNLVSDREAYQAAARYSRVCFYGEGPDNALRHEWPPYLSDLIRRRNFGRLAKDVCELIARSRHIPFLPRILRPFKAWWRGNPEQARFPSWLNQGFASRLRLRERWEQAQSVSTTSPHPRRPEAYRSFAGPLWERLFSQCDAEAVGAAAEFRHPFVDLRLLRYMLAIPVVPWCREKYLIRRAMRGALPDPVLRRPKSPLTGDPRWETARRFSMATSHPAPGLQKYVDLLRVPELADHDIVNFWVDLRPLALNYWLRDLHNRAQEPATDSAQSEYLSRKSQPGKKEIRAAGCSRSE
jgi:asparagine synthase (glutamine-hydrolysing)